LKIKGDLYKYLYQVEVDYSKYLQKAYTYFKQALDLSLKNLPFLDSTSLNTHISFIKFLRNFIKNEEELQRLIKQVKEKDEIKQYLDGYLTPEGDNLGYLEELKNLLID